MTLFLDQKVKIAIIGGSGLYHLDSVETVTEVYPETPWGYPSDKILVCRHGESLIAFLARHGRGHPSNPSEVPNRANIAALKSLGVEIILAFSAVGSLREHIRPLDFVLPNQAIDRTKGIREATFFENGCVAHVEFADPFCKELADIVYRNGMQLFNHADHPDTVEPRLHKDKTLVVMEGPAFSTRAESHMYRSWGCHIINMSTLPEAKLAREAEISYQVVCMATDYDCWREHGDHVTVETVIATLHRNSDNAKKLLAACLSDLERGLKGEGRGAIRPGMTSCAIITAPEKRNAEQIKKLRYLFPDIK